MSVSSLPSDLTAVIALEQPHDDADVETLIERAFGPGRFAKTAERLREHNLPNLTLSYIAKAGGEIVGCVRMWSILIGAAPAVLLGPFAVEDAWRSRGLGAKLIEHACQAARREGCAVVLLVGDEPYFRQFGFVAPAAGQVILPGPVNHHRVLWLDLAGAPLPSGPVRAAPKVAA
jgi:predicted N-acetyltransferase YhbS